MSIYATTHQADWPVIYQGSHVRPRETDPRGGAVNVGIIPDHIEDADDLVRLSVHEMNGPAGCVLLTRAQARKVGLALMGCEPDADLHRLERAIREAARNVDDDERALRMMDAADIIKQVRTS